MRHSGEVYPSSQGSCSHVCFTMSRSLEQTPQHVTQTATTRVVSQHHTVAATLIAWRIHPNCTFEDTRVEHITTITAACRAAASVVGITSDLVSCE